MSDDVGHVASPATAGADAGVFGYDPWGARRNPDGQRAPAASFNLHVGHREFTGHETIPNVGLVNMNGRVYDPALGRFLSPDPGVQAPMDLQSYNRYSYALDNPLHYTDPTGYDFLGVNWGSWQTWVGIGEALLGAAVCAAAPGVGCLAFGLTVALMNAGVSLANGASLEATLFQAAASINIGIVTGGLAGGFGSALGGGLAAMTITGAAGGALTSAMTGLASGQGLGWNVALGAVMGAATSAIAWAVSPPNPISQEDAAEEQGRAARLAEIQHQRALGNASGLSSQRESWFAGAPNGGNPVATDDGSGTAFFSAKAKFGFGGRIEEVWGLNGFMGWMVDTNGRTAFVLELGPSIGAGGSLNFGGVSDGSISYGLTPYARASSTSLGPLQGKYDFAAKKWTMNLSIPEDIRFSWGPGADTGLRLTLPDPYVAPAAADVGAVLQNAIETVQTSSVFPQPYMIIQQQSSVLGVMQSIFGH
jgi:RHS repeat-associated protein